VTDLHRHFRAAGYGIVRADKTLCESALQLGRAVRSLFASSTQGSGFRSSPVDGATYRLDRAVGSSSLSTNVLALLNAHEPLKRDLGELLGPNVVLVLNRHNHLTLGRPCDVDHRFHRDVLQWSRSIVSAVVYLASFGEDAGSTAVVPGSHLLGHASRPNNGGTWLDEWHGLFGELQDQALIPAGQAGDVLLLDGLVFHAAWPGRHPDRPALVLAFRSEDELSDSIDDTDQLLFMGQRLYKGRRSS
jgi:hypothetical protein